VRLKEPGQRAAGGYLDVGDQLGPPLAEEGEEEVLSQGARIPRMPRRLLGKSVHFYGDHLGLIAAPLDGWRGRTQRGDLLGAMLTGFVTGGITWLRRRLKRPH
jgi:putative flavoprotein involved in K+ transport